ncbi:hypothetical protein GCM10025864_12770 [Luteimicrobium album]|uniref:SIS domain-containing protein n=1 Tax=Luteimicrobium album TaxID=1054550 RepID=A0ABQ6HYE9_9MICO|nr:SIS domain-containing protein [Luteimicrobium album]GMA23518.1 hypothetical protein GCM10025864_12770 [Luteimicrobium album]
MIPGYITFEAARATQAAELGRTLPTVAEQIRVLTASGLLTDSAPLFVGIGASLAAAAAPVWALRSRGIDSWRAGAGDQPIPYPTTRHAVVGISQSGRSAETLAVLAAVPDDRRLAVVNTTPSPLSELASVVISLGNLRDSYASTIGYTATVGALGMLADAWDGGTIDPGWDGVPDAATLTEARLADRLADLTPVLERVGYADFVGTGPAVGSAEAGALLLREVARIPSTAMSTRQYLHGSMESANEGLHVLFGDEREVALAQTLADAGHDVLLVTAADVAPTARLHPLRMERRPAAQRALLEALVLQLLAARAAEARGVDVEEFVFHNDDTKVTATPAEGE